MYEVSRNLITSKEVDVNKSTDIQSNKSTFEVYRDESNSQTNESQNDEQRD